MGMAIGLARLRYFRRCKCTHIVEARLFALHRHGIAIHHVRVLGVDRRVACNIRVNPKIGDARWIVIGIVAMIGVVHDGAVMAVPAMHRHDVVIRRDVRMQCRQWGDEQAEARHDHG